MANIVDNKPLGKESSISEVNKSDLSVAVDVSNNRPQPPSSPTLVQKGLVASGTFGSLITPVGFIDYLAGAKVDKISFDLVLKMEELKNVTFSKLSLEMMAVFVPNVRVYPDYDKMVAQREDSFTSVSLLPYVVAPSQSLNVVPANYSPGVAGNIVINQHTMWRDTVAYAYYGDVRAGQDYNAIYPRGYYAMYNDIFRDRRVTPPLIEHKASYVVEESISLFNLGKPISDPLTIPDNWSMDNPGFLLRAPARKNYWNTHWNLNSVTLSERIVDNTSLHQHNVTQRMIDEYRQRAENANKTDEQVIAEIRGTSQARENVCQVIGRKIVEIDMSVLTSSTENDVIQLGSEGAISYTLSQFDLDMSGSFSHVKDGVIHYVYVLRFDDNSLYSTTQNIEVLKRTVDDIYRPTMKEHKDEPLYYREIHSGFSGQDGVIGMRRRFSEYFRHPVFIRGDFQERGKFNQNLPLPVFRTNSAGFMFYPEQNSPELATLPSRNMYHGMRSVYENNDIDSNRLDYSDEALRRLMLYDGGLEPTIIWRRKTNFPFHMFGTVSVGVKQPIDDSIARDLIEFGDE